MIKENKEKLIVILGPTAVGKSALAIKLAKKFNGEVVSADSRQIYKGMDIGTGKITKKEAGAIPHHLLSIQEPDKIFSAGQFEKLAIREIKSIQKKKKVPFLVGGSPLYIYSVIEGWIFPQTKVDWPLRRQLEKKSPEELLKELKELDAQRAKTIEKQNKRRLIRAIEISRELGRVPKLKKEPQFNCLLIGLNISKEKLKERIAKRVDKMANLGLEEEVKQLVKKYGWTPPLRSIGYWEWKDYFEGKIKKSRVIEKIKTKTAQFAKRQMTWFKKPAYSAGKNKIHWVKSQEQAEKLIIDFLD